MAISQKTTKEIVNVIAKWSIKHNVNKLEIIQLFEGLSQVDGNKSFKDSIASLNEIIRGAGYFGRG